jgi:2-succinyl-6-hydroxy-2,4-cyclohexadiene-1-carboxylate synthase
VRAALPRGYRALTPDVRGHGSRSEVRPVTLNGVLEDLCRDAPVGPFILGGYSQGGRIALHACLDPRLRDRVRRLVLIGASPGIRQETERADRRRQDEALAEEAERSSIEEFAVRWGKTPILQGLASDVAAEIHRDRLRSTSTGLAAALRGLGTGALPQLWDRLDEVAAPVTLLVGERDEKFMAVAHHMAAGLPRAEVRVVPRAGHAVHLEAPPAVVRALVDP